MGDLCSQTFWSLSEGVLYWGLTVYVMIFQFSLPSVTITGYSRISQFPDDGDRGGPQNIGHSTT